MNCLKHDGIFQIGRENSKKKSQYNFIYGLNNVLKKMVIGEYMELPSQTRKHLVIEDCQSVSLVLLRVKD